MAASVLVLVGDCDNILDQVVDISSKLVAGQSAGQVGPIIDDIAKERVLKYIQDAEAGGAKVLLDGRGWATKSPGYWIGPTVVLHTSKTDPAILDEIFGPVLSVIKVDSWDQAIGNPNVNSN